MRTFASIAILLFAISSAHADNLIVNGGFESGTLSGWTATSTGDGDFTVTSAPYTPLTYNATVGPNSGTYYAVSDDYSGSQTQFLTQSFTTPNSFQDVILSFSMFVNDVYGSFFGSDGPGGEVTLLSATGSPISVLYGPVDTFENPAGSPNPYVSVSENIASDLAPNTTYQLQFSSTDTQGLINVGVDSVALVATPEPATLFPFALGGLLVLWLACRRQVAVEA